MTGFTSTIPRRTREALRSSSGPRSSHKASQLLSRATAGCRGGPSRRGGPADPGVAATRRPLRRAGKPCRFRAHSPCGKPGDSDPDPAPGASRANPLRAECLGHSHTAPGRRPASHPSARAHSLPSGQSLISDGPETPPPPRGRERGRSAGRRPPGTSTRARTHAPAPPSLSARGSRGGGPASKARPLPGRRHLRPRPRAMFEKEKERARGRARPARPAAASPPRRRPPAPPLTRRPRDQCHCRRGRQHEEEQPGTRSSNRCFHGPAATACGPARPLPRLSKPASPHLPRRGGGLAPALCNCSGAARPLAAGSRRPRLPAVC